MSDPIDVPLRWIDDQTPTVLPAGASLGAPLPRGRVSRLAALGLVDDAGTPVPAQLWPLATWPDGTVKWVGIGLGATATPSSRYRLIEVAGAGPDTSVRAAERADAIVIDTGPMTVTVPRSGDTLVSEIAVGNTAVARHGRLISSVQNTPQLDRSGLDHGIGEVETVTLEQTGPLRAVVRIEGRHRTETGRRWLPFTVRLVASAGSTRVRLVHSFVWDGSAESDFLSSLGIRFDVPLRAQPHDRHVRLAGADGGMLREAVRGVTGLSKDPGAAVRAAQVAGEATAPVDQWDPRVADRLQYVPQWSDWSLRQPNANGYLMRKRTTADRPWITITQGTRADGYGYIGDPRGGLGIGLTHFWQSHPTGIDITSATTESAGLTMWLWSPESEPMDMRFYHDGMGQDSFAEQLDGLAATYEDYQPGFGDAHGIGRTHELHLMAYAATPNLTRLATDAAHVRQEPRLVPTAEALHRAHVFGDWDPVDRSTPERTALEDRLERLLDHYIAEIDQRSWYGFWDYGDVMHSYDPDRHTWRYDIGGYAWDNSELATDLWLWTSFLRTGRADVFRMAEAMARHTGDVDSYHAGPFRGLGSRHNVQHWGCSCKQLRIGSAVFRRPHYFLTADEHSRDLLVALRDADRAYLSVDPTRKSRPDAEQHNIDPTAIRIGLGTDWSALAAAWLADWEITGNQRSRDRLLGTMSDIGGFPLGFLHGQARYDLAQGRFTHVSPEPRISHLSAIFGLVEICSELIDLLEVPGFERAWLRYCRIYLATPQERLADLGVDIPDLAFPQWHSRLLAYAARREGRPDLGRRAWEAFLAGGQYTPVALPPTRRVLPPEVPAPVNELYPLSTNDAAQSSLATIQNLALIGDHLQPRSAAS